MLHKLFFYYIGFCMSEWTSGLKNGETVLFYITSEYQISNKIKEIGKEKK